MHLLFVLAPFSPETIDSRLDEEGENGVNIRLEPGEYELILTVEPPTLMRVEGAIDKWLEPIEAKFTFVVN